MAQYLINNTKNAVLILSIHKRGEIYKPINLYSQKNKCSLVHKNIIFNKTYKLLSFKYDILYVKL